MCRTFSFALLSLFFLRGTLCAQRAVEFEARYWFAAQHSRMRFDNGGTDIDFKNDLGIQDANFPEGRFTFYGKGRSHLHFSYTPIDYTGDSNVSRTLTFGGDQYTVGSRVLTDFQIQHLQLGWAYQFVNVHNGVFKLGTLLQGNGFLMKGRLRAPDLTPAIDDQEDFSVGLPTVGVAMDINPHKRVNFFADVSGIKLGKYGYFVNSDVGVKIRPVQNAFFTAGYRNFNLHAKNDPDFVRVELRGFFIGGGAHF
jgi:hypothetical protein